MNDLFSQDTKRVDRHHIRPPAELQVSILKKMFVWREKNCTQLFMAARFLTNIS